MPVQTAAGYRIRLAPLRASTAVPAGSPAADAFREGVRDALPIGAAFFLAFLGVGAVFQVAGLGAGPAGLSTLLLMAGPAQVSLVEGLQAGQSMLTLLLAVAVINGRYLLLSAVLAPAFRTVPLWRLLLTLTFLNASTFAAGQAGLKREGPAAVLPAMLGTVFGYHVAAMLPEALRATVDMIVPINFVMILARDWPRVRPLLAGALGFLLTPPLERFLPGLGMLTASLAVGLILGLTSRKVEGTVHDRS